MKLCDCHGEPMYRHWQKHESCVAGGYWKHLCAVKERKRQRDNYDNDWRYRITKNLKGNRRKRRETIERRRSSGG